LIAIAVQLDLQIDHFDVTTAFLHGDLEEKVLMVQPEVCMEKGSENKVCLLNKAIYGLKQSSRTWNKKAYDVLVVIGYKRLETEPYVCVKKKVIFL
jgi:ATP-binding cassette subfamily B (MDR/TAP) protein 1